MIFFSVPMPFELGGFVYMSASEMRSKKSTFIITESGYGCPQCGNNYKHKTSLYKHLKYECQKEKQFQCWYCQKKFARKGHLQSHCKYVHDINISRLAVEVIKSENQGFSMTIWSSRACIFFHLDGKLIMATRLSKISLIC